MLLISSKQALIQMQKKTKELLKVNRGTLSILMSPVTIILFLYQFAPQ